jgi:hypothetical protein
MASVATINLISVLVGLFAQFGPKLIQGVLDLFHRNPQGQDETDAAYIERINGLAAAKLADATANDAAVEAAQPTTAPV